MKKSSISKIQNKRERTDTTNHLGEYIIFFTKLNLESIPDRDVFISKVTNHLEPNIKKIIKNEINENKTYYEPIWRTLVITGKKPYANKTELGEIVISHHTFSSTIPINNQLDSYSLIKNFIKYYKNEEYSAKLNLFYDKHERNDIDHEGLLTNEINQLKEIQPNIGDFIYSILRMFRMSLEYGRLITKKDLKKYSEIIELQKTELEKSDQKICKLDNSLQRDKNEFQNQFKILKRNYGVN
jgi:hypothetical protein